MLSEAFAARIAELDAMVDACRNEPPFSTGIVRDHSNRTGRDWPWWTVTVEQTRQDGGESCRAEACIELGSTRDCEPGSYRAWWSVRIWSGSNTDSFRQKGEFALDWNEASPEALKRTMTTLLSEASHTIDEALRNRSSW